MDTKHQKIGGIALLVIAAVFALDMVTSNLGKSKAPNRDFGITNVSVVCHNEFRQYLIEFNGGNRIVVPMSSHQSVGKSTLTHGNHCTGDEPQSPMSKLPGVNGS